MTEKDEQVVADCLDLILAGTETVENLVQQYPHLAVELKELVQSAELFQELPVALAAQAQPSAAFQAEAKTRLLKQLPPSKVLSKAKNTVPTKQKQWDVWGWLFGRNPALGYALGGMMLLILLSSGTLYASNNAIPGDPLYGIKSGIEEYQFDNANPTNQIDLHLSYADKRLGELEALAIRSRKQYITPTSLAYASQLEQAVEELDGLKNPSSPLVGKMGQLVTEHQVRLEKLDVKIDQLNKSDPEANVAIEAVHQALNTSVVYLETGIVTNSTLSLWEIIQKNEEFSSFRNFVGWQPDLRDQLSINGPFTLFLPTNQAIEQGKDQLATIESDPKRVRQWILYHYLQGAFSADMLTGEQRTALGIAAKFSLSADGSVMINDQAKVTAPVITTRNGNLYIIDHPLMPPSFP